MQDPTAASAYRLGDDIDLSSATADAFLVSGFSFREDWGRWTDGSIARLSLAHGAARGLLFVELKIGRAFCHEGEMCDLILQMGRGEPKLFSIGPDATRLAALVAAEETSTPGTLDIVFLVVRPKRQNEPPDARALGVGIERLRVTQWGAASD